MKFTEQYYMRNNPELKNLWMKQEQGNFKKMNESEMFYKNQNINNLEAVLIMI